MGLINAGSYVSPSVSGDEVRPIRGIKYGYIEQSVIPAGAAGYDLAVQLPIGAVILNAQIKLSAAVVCTTAVKIGLGRKESAADPDKYALTSALTTGTYSGTKITVTGVLADASAVETLRVFACDTNGAAAGTLDSGGTITARVNYLVYESID